jgi:hypothetical protein
MDLAKVDAGKMTFEQIPQIRVLNIKYDTGFDLKLRKRI